MKKAALVPVILLCLSLLALPQDYKGKGRVTGCVYDEAGNLLEGVTVKLFSLAAQQGFSVVTDSKGKWTAAWVRSGEWDVDFEKPGYLTKKISIQVSEAQRNPEVEVNLQKVEGMVATASLEKELNEGNSLYGEGKYEEAVAVFAKILERFPEAYIININIGNCYFQQEKYGLAEEYYLKVLERDPGNAQALLALGNTYTNLGEIDKAQDRYRKIEFEKIDNPIVLYNIGTNFYNQSQPQEALKYYKKAVEIKGDFLDGLYQLGLTHLALGQNAEAIAAFEKYLTHDSDSGRAGQVRSFLNYLRKK